MIPTRPKLRAHGGGTGFVSLVCSSNGTRANHSDACTAGLVLIICRLHSPLWISLDHDELSVAWGRCQDILQSQTDFSFSARKSLDLLVGINENLIAKQGGEPEK